MRKGLLGQAPSDNPTVQECYGSRESRLGYWLLLNNNRHGGLYDEGQRWPFPIWKAQHRMKEKLHARLGLEPGATVLDAGAGSGEVAIFMAGRGLTVKAIDITPIHVDQARKNVKASGLERNVSVAQQDYESLDNFNDKIFDGAYSMEAFVHADDQAKTLENIYRVLRPGGVLVLHEAYLRSNSTLPGEVFRLWHWPHPLKEGGHEKLLTNAGFKDFSIEDLTEEVLPFWRFLGVLAYIPYRIFKLFGIQHRFANTMVVAELWSHWGEARYVSVRVVKPGWTRYRSRPR